MATRSVLVDEQNGDAYYLGFDLLLVHAPFRAGEVQTGESWAVEGNETDAEEAARHAAIKAALLTADLAGNVGWESTIEQAQRRAEALATTAGLSAPPRLEHAEVRRIDLG